MKKIIGWIFIVIGLIWSILNRWLCNQLCNSCNVSELSPCYFLFLLVGIIFIVAGTSLILTSDNINKISTKRIADK